MLLNRVTHNIPFNEASIAKVMYGESCSGPFVSVDEINQKTSSADKIDYSKKIPGVDYRSFGEKINLEDISLH